MISKELLNKNRVLTISNSKTCGKLIVNFKANSEGRNTSIIIMGINDRKSTKDIIFIKEIHSEDMSELVYKVYWNCREYGIEIVLIDINGYGKGFYDAFKDRIDGNRVSIRPMNMNRLYTDDIADILKELHSDIEDGRLRFLQTPEIAIFSYDYTFLGFNDIMNSHLETTKLINEIDNMKEICKLGGRLRLECKSNEIRRIRFDCLLLYYGYPLHGKFIK